MSRIACAVVLTTLLAGCSVLRPERPNWQTYVLEVPSADPGARSSNDAAIPTPGTDPAPVLRVSPMQSAGGYDTPRMAYTKSSDTIEYFAGHRWAEPPADMLVAQLVSGLDQSHAFAATLAPSSRGRGDYILETELLTFCQEFEGSSPRFRVALRATILVAQRGRVTGAPRTFEVAEPMSAASPTAGVEAARKACARLVQDLVGYCRDVVNADQARAPAR